MKKRILSILLTLCMLFFALCRQVYLPRDNMADEWDGGSFHSGGTGFSNQRSFIRNSQTDVRHYPFTPH
ncbi:MAG: hypothetical protein ACLTD2_00705 [Ruminococcus sp.]